MPRDDFALDTKRRLAERVSFRCSFPDCSALTLGPSDEDSNATNNIGMACHISAASPGRNARRYDRGMTSEQRRSIENGIWMCYSHGKLIDSDEIRFTAEMLKTWKVIAETRAQLMLDLGTATRIDISRHVKTLLPKNAVTVELHHPENEVIGNAIRDSCVSILWGEAAAHAVRDLCIEVCRNAFRHGKATQCVLAVNEFNVTLIDNGDAFDPLVLSSSFYQRRGGKDAIEYVFNSLDDRVILRYERIEPENHLVITSPRTKYDFMGMSSCSYEIPRSILGTGSPAFSSDFLPDCSSVYFLLPDYYTLSDIYALEIVLERLRASNRKFVFAGINLSPRAVSLIGELFPESQVVTLWDNT